MSIQSIQGIASTLTKVVADTPAKSRSRPDVAQGPPDTTTTQDVDIKEAKDVKQSTEFDQEREEQEKQPQPELENVIEDLNQSILDVQRDIVLALHEDSGESVVRVIDTESQKVITQFPSDQVLAAAEKLETMQGILFEKKA